MGTKTGITAQRVINVIYNVRGKKVMMDSDLAELYGVTTGNLNKAVARNLVRFPEDFMFELTKEEFNNLRSEIGSSSWGGRRKPPKVFTEQGVAMLSGVLQSDRAVKVNIQIMRVYTKMREMLLTHKDLLLKVEAIEKKVTKNDKEIKAVFSYLKKFIQQQKTPRKAIGYKGKSKKK